MNSEHYHAMECQIIRLNSFILKYSAQKCIVVLFYVYTYMHLIMMKSENLNALFKTFKVRISRIYIKKYFILEFNTLLHDLFCMYAFIHCYLRIDIKILKSECPPSLIVDICHYEYIYLNIVVSRNRNCLCKAKF